ncbi:MAG: SDR family NAD(P)-dependent oxidoreductase, partial [Candidatus Aminicenantes bacterium]
MTFDHHTSVEELFEKQVNKTPNRIAVVGMEELPLDTGTPHRQEEGRFIASVTYRELNQQANQIARILKKSGIKTGDIVAIDLDFAVERVAGMMGILKAGGAYLVINPAYAGEYANSILHRSKTRYLLTSGNGNKHPKFSGKTVMLNHGRWSASRKTEPNPGIGNTVQNPLLVSFCSNSARGPEGVILCHKNIVDWIRFNLEKLNVDFSHTLFISSLSSLEMAFPIWIANLITGGRILFSQWEHKEDICEMIHLMQNHPFKSVICPLHFLQTLVLEDQYKHVFSSTIRNIVTMGEDVFNASEFRTFVKDKGIRWHNYYGFPEMSMITALVEDNALEGIKSKHVGRPASDTDTYILNQASQLVDIGILGELYVSGSGVMDQYYKNEELNQSHFLQKSVIPGKKIYKTGYKASWLPDWKVSLFGRVDQRVNINGCRFTPEEIETLLLKHNLINDCAVVLRKTSGSVLKLTAYLVLEEDISMESIEEFLRNFFLIDIIPIGFVKLFSLPRTSDGGVDRKYLEELEFYDTTEIKTLENEIKKEKEIEHVGIIVKEKIEKPTPLHLKDFSPQFEKVSTKDIKDSVESFTKEIDKPNTQIPLAIVHGEELKEEEGDPRTLIDILDRAARENGEKGIVFIHADGTEYFQVYPSLLEEAERILSGLRKINLQAQDIVIFQFDRDEDYLAAFWGCTLGGIIPAPLAVPKSYDESNNETNALYNIWKMLDKPVVLSSKSLKKSIGMLFKDFQVTAIEELRGHEPKKDWHQSHPGDLALLLFTSGSTGMPKGVVHNHQTILALEKGSILLNDWTTNDISINWMPLEHVGGIVESHLRDVYLGCQQVQVRMAYILSDPLRWLDLMTQYKATCSWAPNFAYALIKKQIEEKNYRNWDLSSMRFLMNGGEAINAGTVKAFLKLLAPCYLSPNAVKPAWGMSETCSGVVYSHLLTPEPGEGVHHLDKFSLGGSIRKSHSEADNVTFVELGKPIPGISIRIVDSENHVLTEGVIGRLQVKGLSVTPGYINNPQLNNDVFTADGWMDTGDLTFIQNGRMTITGRAKDVIIINGINYNSVEIESVVESVQGVEASYTAACAVQDPESNTDKLALFFSSVFPDFSRVLMQVKDIRKIVVQKIGLNADYIIPLSKQEIPKTSIGKLQRSKLVKKFESGYFEETIKRIDILLENENTLPSWFLRKAWKREEILQLDYTGQGNNCLVFEDQLGLSGALINKLAENACKCIRVKTGSQFKRIDAKYYEIDYREPDDYNRLFEAVYKDVIQIHDIFHLYCYSESELNPGDFDTGFIKNAQFRGVYSLLSLIQALNRKANSPIRLFVVSSHAHWVSGHDHDQVAYEKCGISGFLKSVSLELSWLQCRHIDLELGTLYADAECLLREWRNLRESKEVAYRSGERLVPFLFRLDMRQEALQEIPLRNGGIYLVTGGLGGIGTHVCKWLMKNFQAKLIIVGRTNLSERENWSTLLEENTVISKRVRGYLDIESVSSDFIYGAGDICDGVFLNRLIARAESKWKESLSGIFHLAGMGNLESRKNEMDDHLVTSETQAVFDTMYHSKVYGTLVLHRLLENKPHLIFVAFSSIISLFGAIGYSAYAAANSFLDSFCLYRRCNGYTHTYCLNWSAWDNIGMNKGNPEHVMHAMHLRGYEMISSRQGLDSILISLQCNPGQIIIGLNSVNDNIRKLLKENPSDKQVIKVYYSIKNGMEISGSALFRTVSNIISSQDKKRNVIPELHQMNFMPLKQGAINYEQLKKIDTHSVHSVIEFAIPRTEEERTLVKIWKEILEVAKIGIDDNFFVSGGNSLKCFALISKMHKELNIKVPPEEIFKRPTIRGLSEYIKGSEEDKYVSIDVIEKRSCYDLSSAQKRLYILQQIELQSTTYNIPLVVLLEGELDKTKVVNTLKRLIARHESLR